MIPKISAEDLKKMQDREGLVLQGCGGIFRNGKMASIKCWQKKKYCKMGRTLKKYTHLSMRGVPICCS